ncbi:hypothetical protein MEO41_28660, partial [Dolichospermum sp. ST_sed4]|nr:hypothetical protein [Dolichospermum sp. ST_sed4]
IERLGYVLVFAAMCWGYSRWRKTQKSFVLDASRESLLIYWLHLITIYGMFWAGQSLAILIGPNLNVWENIGATLILMALMILSARIWGWTKIKFPKYAGKVAWGIVGVLFIIFLV